VISVGARLPEDERDGGEQPAALSAILARLGRELDDLARCADDLQNTISGIVAGSRTALSLEAQVGLQAADLLTQRLDRLARLMGSLEAEVPQAGGLDGLLRPSDSLRRDLERLGNDGGATPQSSPEDAGDCELF